MLGKFYYRIQLNKFTIVEWIYNDIHINSYPDWIEEEISTSMVFRSRSQLRDVTEPSEYIPKNLSFQSFRREQDDLMATPFQLITTYVHSRADIKAMKTRVME